MAKNLAKEQNAMSAASVFKAIDNVLKKYEPALPRRLRWSEWAYPLDAEGKLDYEKMLKGDELLNFVRSRLTKTTSGKSRSGFPHLSHAADADESESQRWGCSG